MAAMKFVVKYFSEIAIKSKPVRRCFISQLTENIRSILRDIDTEVVVTKSWDRLFVETASGDAAVQARLIEAMRHAPGITYRREVG
jgi:thiamine biosynthesis protein ThiI